MLKTSYILGYLSVALIGIGNITDSQNTRIIQIVALSLICIVITLKSIVLKRVYINKPQAAFIAFSIIFGWTFWKLSAPEINYNGDPTSMPDWWWEELVFSIGLAAIAGTLFDDNRKAIIAIGIFCAVPTLMQSWSILYSLIYEISLTDSTYSPFLGFKISNAGLCNQLLYLPTFLFFYNLNAEKSKKTVRLITLSAIYILVSTECFILKKRVCFIMLYCILPFISIMLKVIKKDIKIKKIASYIALAIIMVCGFVFVANQMGRQTNIFSDGRFGLQSIFLKQFFNHPFKNASLDINDQIAYGKVWWFHNFFADVHRSSGIIPFVLAVILVGFIGARIYYNIFYKGGNMIFFLMFIFVFLILNSSVVPEGEFQPLLLVLLLGSINESVLARGANKLKIIAS
jgi:hypothetical protein